MTLGQIALTSQGPMVGDYISTSFSGGRAVTVFPVGLPATGAAFDEASYAPAPLAVASATAAVNASTTAGVVAGPGIGETIQAIRRD
jgi:hypothetical protein